MAVLTIKSLYLFNPKEGTAKYVEFSPGKNVLTSSKEDGNHVGKTTILKSIYHTLGADCVFDSKWPIKDIISIAVVEIDATIYHFYRHDRLHRVFQDGKLLCEATHKSDLSAFLEQRFGLAVYLPNRTKDELELAPPAFSYVLNYLDKPQGPYFSSFDNLTQYSGVKDTIIYNHLGAFDKRYYQLKRQHEELTAKKNEYETKLNMLQIMIDRISSEIIESDYSTSLEALNREISATSRVYRELVDSLSKLKQTIIDLSNTRISIEKQIESIAVSQKTTMNEMIKLNERHICPRCHSALDDLAILRATGYNQQAAMIVMHDELSSQLVELDRRISGIQEKYKIKLSEIDSYKQKLRKAQNYSDNIVRQEGAIQIKEQFLAEAEALYTTFLGLKEKINALNKDLAEYQEKIRALNDEYYPLMKDALARFSLEEIEDDNIKTLTKVFKPTQNNMRLATVIWLYTLLRLKKKYNPDALILPILIDSPSYGELDSTKENELWKYVFAIPTISAQLIITKLNFTDDMVQEYSVDNIINLGNPKYRLLNTTEYAQHLGLLDELHQISSNTENEDD